MPPLGRNGSRAGVRGETRSRTMVDAGFGIPPGARTARLYCGYLVFPSPFMPSAPAAWPGRMLGVSLAVLWVTRYRRLRRGDAANGGGFDGRVVIEVGVGRGSCDRCRVG